MAPAAAPVAASLAAPPGGDSLARVIWRNLDSTPLDIDTGVDPALAQAVADALATHTVPLVARRDGRVEPLASGVFYRAGQRLCLVTCRHVFDDGATLGDLGVALPRLGRVRWLRETRARLLAHPEHDLAVILIGAGEFERELRRAWPALPLEDFDEARVHALVLAGYAYAQIRRVDDVLHARPVVVFARWLQSGADVRASYARTARRADGLPVPSPELDGASGATLWACERWPPTAATCCSRPPCSSPSSTMPTCAARRSRRCAAWCSRPEMSRRAVFLLLAALFAGLLGGCAHGPDPAAVASVLQTDRDFAERAAAAGLRVAFLEYAAPDAMLFRAGVGPIRGEKAIGDSFAGVGDARLEWSPEAAEVAASGELAYTWGWYTFSAGGKSSTGNYVSIWRRIDGRWRYVVDLGVPAPKP